MTPDRRSPLRTFARFVPERLDDFAWESDRIAYRMVDGPIAALILDSFGGGPQLSVEGLEGLSNRS